MPSHVGIARRDRWAPRWAQAQGTGRAPRWHHPRIRLAAVHVSRRTIRTAVGSRRCCCSVTTLNRRERLLKQRSQHDFVACGARVKNCNRDRWQEPEHATDLAKPERTGPVLDALPTYLGFGYNCAAARSCLLFSRGTLCWGWCLLSRRGCLARAEPPPTFLIRPGLLRPHPTLEWLK
jgi:hypothetical protein